MSLCRFCLANKPRKDITELNVSKNGEEKNYTEILFFCLGIQAEEDSKVSRKLCVKCFRKTIQFYEFKALAIKNEFYFKFDNVRVLSPKDEIAKDEIKMEARTVQIDIKEEPAIDDGSDDELLSDIKKVKYEYVEETENATRKPNKSNLSKRRIDLKAVATKVCEECGKYVRNLKSHALTHLPVEQRRQAKCDLCDKVFTSEKSKWKHKSRNHFGVKQECPICHSKVFCLLRHKRQVHDKEKTHLCQYCSKCFFNKGHLQTHLRTHTKEKPFMCVTCGKCFVSRTSMKNHMLIHTGDKKHACSLCDMTFVNVGYLNAHMLSHTKEKRFPCQYCGVRFHRSDHRKRHEFTAHLKKTIVMI